MSKFQENVQKAIDVNWGDLPTCGTQGLVVSPNFCENVGPSIPLPDAPIPAVPIPSAGLLFVFALSTLVLARKRRL